MSKSSEDSVTNSSGSGKASPERPGAERLDSQRLQIEELMRDLIGGMERLSRDERRRERIAKKLF